MKKTVLDVFKLSQAVKDICRKRGFTITSWFDEGKKEVLCLSIKSQAKKAPSIYVSAGIHGDEPSGTLALIRLLDIGFFEDSCINWTIIPMLNPSGMLLGHRGNFNGRDNNRGYLEPTEKEIIEHIKWLKADRQSYKVCLCLHEDWEAEGYYFYEINRSQCSGFSKTILSAVKSILPIDIRPKIDGHNAKNGVITVKKELHELTEWAEPAYLMAYHTDLCYVLESPSGLSIDQRVQAHIAAIQRITDDIGQMDLTL